MRESVSSWGRDWAGIIVEQHENAMAMSSFLTASMEKQGFDAKIR
jgi:hypothetical protein